MWEVFTEGKMPFETNLNHEVVAMVMQGHRLPHPKKAAPHIYEIMQHCWQEVRGFMCAVHLIGFVFYSDNKPDVFIFMKFINIIITISEFIIVFISGFFSLCSLETGGKTVV